MNKIRFGPAGIPLQSEEKTTIGGIITTSKIGLNAMEIEFVQGVRMGEKTASEVRAIAEKHNISISSHAPYYINFCSLEDVKVANSNKHLFSAAKLTWLCGGNITVFHPGFYKDLSKEEAFNVAKKNLSSLVEEIKSHNIKIRLGAETVGKKSAFGGLIENIRLSKEFDLIEPVIDFAHLHARGDFKLTDKESYRGIFNLLENELGDYVKRFHSHFSEINYTQKGESNHLPLGSNNEPPIVPLLELLAENGYSGTIICETPQIEMDSLKMKSIYEKLVK